MSRNKKNSWKWLFFLLLTLNVLFVFSVFLLVTTNPKPESEPHDDFSSDEYTEYFSVHLTQSQLNHLLQEQLEEEKVSAEIIDKKARISSSVSILGRTINASMDFEPAVLENGNIVLHQQSFNIGGLSLPGSEVLSILSSQADVPDYVEVQPGNNQIVVKLNEIEIADQYYLRAETFDLEQDAITIKVGK
ncbi:YpmS family protein [Alteribacillus sp. YIM 98480]|uniref:YpmS family protein n=1 Tax=Alteribacillus sp. YIM 98480 TaxID=2606599 RepID=UPI00131CDDCC|nr:YpmS family protein [Alteribacillus sp. YIM 98480]